MLKKALTTAAVASALVSTPVIAQAVEAERASAPVTEHAELGEGNGAGLIIAILAAAAIVGAIIIAVGGDDEDDLPTSP